MKQCAWVPAFAGTTEQSPVTFCVPPARIKQIWPHVSHLIAAAMRRGGISDFAELERAVLAGENLLWLALRADDLPPPRAGEGGGGGKERGGLARGGHTGTILAAAVTALHTVNGDKLCTIVACGGRERARWLALKSALEDFARAEGCRAIRILGRSGWARLLPDYSTTRILLQKELT
jgi:hypothetical protein